MFTRETYLVLLGVARRKRRASARSEHIEFLHQVCSLDLTLARILLRSWLRSELHAPHVRHADETFTPARGRTSPHWTRRSKVPGRGMGRAEEAATSFVGREGRSSSHSSPTTTTATMARCMKSFAMRETTKLRSPFMAPRARAHINGRRRLALVPRARCGAQRCADCLFVLVALGGRISAYHARARPPPSDPRARIAVGACSLLVESRLEIAIEIAIARELA